MNDAVFRHHLNGPDPGLMVGFIIFVRERKYLRKGYFIGDGQVALNGNHTIMFDFIDGEDLFGACEY